MGADIVRTLAGRNVVHQVVSHVAACYKKI